jgi:hypothetical protein
VRDHEADRVTVLVNFDDAPRTTNVAAALLLSSSPDRITFDGSLAGYEAVVLRT